MPELPEVEIATRNLRDWLSGERLERVDLPASRILRGASPDELSALLKGRRVAAIERRGKWIRIRLDGDGLLYSHLGMTGKWVRRDRKDPAQRYERARLDTRSSSVRYLDPRLFGRLVAAPRGEPLDAWEALGPDPLADGLDARKLAARLSGRRSIKEALMDQSVLAGLGNIQAAEALWRARIHPQLTAERVARDPARVRALARAIHDSIGYTIAGELGPEITYVEEPGADNPFRVYGKAGQPCPRCKRPLVRIVQGGRSTFYCRRCQKR
jgi:formamidopyrimidine-DNA glycosylase